MIATGGGTADGKIKVWNIYNGNVLHTADAKSQISCLLWSKDFKEIISSHGYSLNQLTVWNKLEVFRHKIRTNKFSSFGVGNCLSKHKIKF